MKSRKIGCCLQVGKADKMKSANRLLMSVLVFYNAKTES